MSVQGQGQGQGQRNVVRCTRLHLSGNDADDINALERRWIFRKKLPRITNVHALRLVDYSIPSGVSPTVKETDAFSKGNNILDVEVYLDAHIVPSESISLYDDNMWFVKSDDLVVIRKFVQQQNYDLTTLNFVTGFEWSEQGKRVPTFGLVKITAKDLDALREMDPVLSQSDLESIERALARRVDEMLDSRDQSPVVRKTMQELEQELGAPLRVRYSVELPRRKNLYGVRDLEDLIVARLQEGLDALEHPLFHSRNGFRWSRLDDAKPQYFTLSKPPSRIRSTLDIHNRMRICFDSEQPPQTNNSFNELKMTHKDAFAKFSFASGPNANANASGLMGYKQGVDADCNRVCKSLLPSDVYRGSSLDNFLHPVPNRVPAMRPHRALDINISLNGGDSVPLGSVPLGRVVDSIQTHRMPNAMQILHSGAASTRPLEEVAVELLLPSSSAAGGTPVDPETARGWCIAVDLLHVVPVEAGSNADLLHDTEASQVLL